MNKNLTTHKSLINFLLILFVVLLGMHLYVTLDHYSGGYDMEDWMYRKFNFNREKNFPSIYSTLLLLGASISLFFVFLKKKKTGQQFRLWISLSIVFLYLASDELLRIHEKLGNLIKDNYDTSGILHYAWLIPYLIAVAVLFMVTVKPIFQLPKKTLYGFIAAAILFVGGAAGMEMVSGYYISTSGIEERIAENSYQVFVFYTIEESLEMLGVITFIYFILDYYRNIALNR